MDTAFDLPIMGSPERRDRGLQRQDAAQQGGQSLRSLFSQHPPPQAADSRPRRAPPPRLGRDGNIGGGSIGRSHKTRMSPTTNALPKSLLPVTEKRSLEENKPDMRFRRDPDTGKVDITPDGGSAGREGRHFTVANVGNNGRIYLKPTVRPAHQRYPQPQFVFPMTPPATANLEPAGAGAAAAAPAADGAKDNGRLDVSLADGSQLFGSQWTPTPTPSTPTTAKKQYFESRLASRPRHRRAVSDSTIPDTIPAARESDPGGFKIVITQPGEDQRPKTSRTVENAAGPDQAPTLDVAIPSWKLGNPRFTLRGTPIIRGSSCGAPTEEPMSARSSVTNRSPGGFMSALDSARSRKPSPINLPYSSGQANGAFSPTLPPPLRSTYMSTHLVIQPNMFDDLTFKPECDDRSIVRYSPATGAVTAATPPRLVAEITSPSFLDYELLSDFFLTFRAFLESNDLLKMLIARLRWALAREDQVGMVVRVRTFVALRHWILNYFVDDFVVDYQLRVMFCNLLNDFVDELTNDATVRKVQIKILAELKKCWRRVCGQYWDGPEFDAALGPEVPIAPGGIAGHRSGGLDPSFWEGNIDESQQLDTIFAPLQDPAGVAGGVSFYEDVSRAGHIDTIINEDDRPRSPEYPNRPPPTSYKRAHATSPLSVSSIDVISCSFPTKTLAAQPKYDSPLAAHPVDPSSIYSNSSDPVAVTPKALTGKRVRPQHAQHKRNGSLTDSLREHKISSCAEKLIYKNAEILMALPFAGSLVRGALLPPGQAFVDVLTPSSVGGPSRQTTVFQPYPLEEDREKAAASAMSGQGMRKLLGSVRRALSTRGQVVSPTQGNFINVPPLGPRGATTNRLPGTAIVPQARPVRQNGARPPVRIDILGAEIAEDFKKAVREDEAAEAAKNGYLLPDLGEDDGTSHAQASSNQINSSLQVHHPDDSFLRPISDAAITTGSKSIVIVDDTLPLEFPVMAGALPAVNLSVEQFAESLMPTGADPTPPNTPPGHVLDTPRRSSYVLRQQVRQLSRVSQDSSLAHFPSPPGLAISTIGTEAVTRPSQDTTRPSVDVSRPSLDFTWQSSSRPPLSGVGGRRHFRQRSSKSYRSMQSYGRKRHASFTSGIVPQPTIRSFDATTYSDASVADDGDQESAAVPQPLRVLRRRPGGDLRAATNIGDLDHHPLRKSRSVGSLTTYSESVRSSYIRSPVQDSSIFVDEMTSEYTHERANTFSLGAIAELKSPKKELSLFSTHSSKPVMRPSFEAEAQKLAQIPDDADDDGGVESALLKLEGKFERKPFKLSMDIPRGPAPANDPSGVEDDHVIDMSHHSATKSEKKDHRHRHVDEDTHLSEVLDHVHVMGEGEGVHVTTVELKDSDSHHHASQLLPPKSLVSHDGEVRSFLSVASGESYSSIPLLERGLTDDGRSKKTITRAWTDRSVFEDAAATPSPCDSKHPSYDFVNKTPSLDQIAPGQTVPKAGAASTVAGDDEQSFLDDASDAGSDLSSEMSVELLGDQEPVNDQFGRQRSGTIVSRLPVHPLGDPMNADPAMWPQPLKSHPPSPPMTLVQALQMSPESANVPRMHEDQIWGEKPLPPTPDTTPTMPAHDRNHQAGQSQDSGVGGAGLKADSSSELGTIKAAPALSPQDQKYAAHLPFILAFDSEILAQQFTLIEKDALNEIDWKELSDMRWKNAGVNDGTAGGASGINSRSWVDFLRNTDAHGVEVVMARFNIMVKWCVSEVVLTQDLEERARCIIKFVHIAAHCRRYRNFATMSQIAIALTSPEVSRLTRTWAMVPPHDMTTLRDLEALVSPTRNFYNLRAEMEGGGAAPGVSKAAVAEMGCIPFVGIYTHDLLFNAQRPSEIASSPTTAPLVNFERCRCAAGVIKTLLRLLEASTMYDFQPIEGITERCLWMSALNDDEIRRLSERLD